jgi:hypothetical protein
MFDITSDKIFRIIVNFQSEDSSLLHIISQSGGVIEYNRATCMITTTVQNVPTFSLEYISVLKIVVH